MTQVTCPKCSGVLAFIEADPENDQPALWSCRKCGVIMDDEILMSKSSPPSVPKTTEEIVAAAPVWYTCSKCGHRHYKYRGHACRVYWDHFQG